MKRTPGKVIQLKQSGQQVLCRVKFEDSLSCQPGQYLQCRSAVLEQSCLSESLFPIRLEDSEFEALLPDHVGWHVGTEITVRGGLGNGFNLPSTARRISLISLDTHPYRLAWLARQIAAYGKDVNLFINQQITSFDPMDFPHQMEILPLEHLEEIYNWSEYVAIDISKNDLALINQFRLDKLTCPAQILIFTDMPCGGLADCGICRITGTNGISLLCKDGPVIDLSQYEYMISR